MDWNVEVSPVGGLHISEQVGILVERLPTGSGFDDQQGTQDGLVVCGGRHGSGESGETCTTDNGKIVCGLNRLHRISPYFG